MIKIQDLNFHYKASQPIYSGLNMELHRGNIYGLLGENGVGKTTLLKLISGLLFPTTGHCSTFDFEAKKRYPEMLEKIYFIPEVYTLPKIKMSEYVNLYASFYPKFDYQKLNEYVDVFGLSQTKKLSEFSHGQQKKWLIAFGLATNTELLLMDEPTNGLDIPSKSLFRQLLVEAMNDQKTVIISTHQVRDLENLIDPIIILEHNQVLLNNSIDEISQKLKFVLNEKSSDVTLYAEPAVGGVWCVEPNTDGIESKVNIELLFNAAILNKELFKKLFIQN
ncbi:MAG: ABC transporter ATP-binding protein [Bacteroidales bacterium]|nr:ABC transporter ATP-binding protein [Bacteroidales bacterium]